MRLFFKGNAEDISQPMSDGQNKDGGWMAASFRKIAYAHEALIIKTSR